MTALKRKTIQWVFCTGLLLAWLLALPACSQAPSSNPKPDPPKHLTLLYFGDLHGHLLPFKRYYEDKELSGGFARLAHLVKDTRARNRARNAATMLLSSGDNFQGSPLSTAYQGEAEFTVFNSIGLDATVVGNHDFDFGAHNLYDLINRADFPILSANTYYLTGSDLVFDPYVILRTPNGLRVGIIGLTTPETSITTHPAHVANLRFTRPELALQQFLERVRKRADVVVVLSHLGIQEDKRLAGLFPGIDVIIGGHSHSILSSPIVVGNVIVTHAGENGLYLGRLDLEVTRGSVRMVAQQLLPVGNHVPEDEPTKAVIESFSVKLSAELSRVVGESACLLDGERNRIRTRETNLGDLIADLMRLRTRVDVALINSGAIRSSIHPGPITLEDVINAFPMNNQIVTMEMSGRDLYLTLKRSAVGLAESTPTAPFGGFLQVSGLTYEIRGGDVRAIRVGGEPLNLYKTYRVVALDFLVAGGDGYREVKQAHNHYHTGITVQDLLLDHLRLRPVLDAETDGRIRIP